MGSADVDQYRDELLIESSAKRLGLGGVASRFPGRNPYPPYILVGAGLILKLVILDGYNILFDAGVSFITNPEALVIQLGLILGVIGVRYMQDGYADAILELRMRGHLPASVETRFRGMFSYRVRIAVYLLALVLNYSFLFFVLGFSTVVSIEGLPSAVIVNFVLAPLIWLPLAVDFALSYIGIHVILPNRIADADLGLFFFDPKGLGGYAPVGQLLKRSYYLYTAALLLYMLQQYGKVVLSEFVPSPYPEPGPIIAVAITAAWLVGILSIMFSMIRMHQVMAAERERGLKHIESEIRAAINNPFHIEDAEVVNSDDLTDIQQRLEWVRATRTFPASFAMWTQILITVLLPQALNLVLQFML